MNTARLPSAPLLALLLLACAFAQDAAPAVAASRPAATGPARDFEAHVRALRERLPAPGFGIAVESPFVVIAEGGEAVARRWARGTVRWAVQTLKQEYFERDPEGILDIWLFESAPSYRRYANQLFGRPPTTTFGYYSSTDRALVMNIATGGGTLVHEIVHPYVAANFPGCPAWLNEGLGSLYEQSAERAGRIVGLTNWRLGGLQKAIRGATTVPLADLFATTTAEFYGERSGLHYAEARYLLYWLQEQGKLKEFWHAFRAAHPDDPSGLATFQKVTGVRDLAAFQKEWEKFVAALVYD